MKAVYSFWSKPFGKSGNGYPSNKHFLVSVCYSALLSKKLFDKVVLYCSADFIPIFEHLGVFDEVILAFDNLEQLPVHHWAVAKMDVYSRQTEPFWHIDNDVYLHKPAMKQFFNKNLIAQSVEHYNHTHFMGYNPQIISLDAHTEHPPHWIKDWQIKHKEFGVPFSFNAGIIGGHDIEFITEYAKDGVEFMLQNSILPDINTTIEQLYFGLRAFVAGKKVSVVLDNHTDNHKAFELGYMHFWGGTKKSKNKKGEYRLDVFERELPAELRIKIKKIDI
jgi:hypothetical protein